MEDIITLQEVANYLKVDERTIHRMLKLNELPAFKVGNQWRFKKEIIDKWIEDKIIGTDSPMNDKIEIPIVGKVAAGTPVLAEENIEGNLTVDKSLSGNSDGVFALRVKGNSMIDADILDGDFVIVQQKSRIEQGEIAVVLIDNEAAIKRIYKEKGKAILKAANESMPPIVIDPKKNSLSIIGKVKGVIRKI